MKITCKTIISGMAVSYLCAGTISIFTATAADAHSFAGGHSIHIGGGASHIGSHSIHMSSHNMGSGMHMGSRELGHENFGHEGFRHENFGHEGFRHESFRHDEMSRRDDWGRGRDRDFGRREGADRFRHDELAKNEHFDSHLERREFGRLPREERIREQDNRFGTTAYALPEHRIHEGSYFNVGQ
jgi:hypothetical protein